MEEPCAAGAAAPLRGDSEEPKQGSVLFLGGNEVKSSAVVKYSSAPPQAAFARLQEKTDLKLPPANWLRESAKLGPAGTSILGNSKKSKPFSRSNWTGSASPSAFDNR
ncbi:hypothetical protein DUI87_11382 [Hirundo rustica rustica]|uniref:EDRF1 N-terminal domain-containing protein n=1 Tax=Hirundo rustica rustica TaxID=333673 RepID=A0A3M0KJ04_HIRRU|nr:hypothetical protein DUI87_11382 [Hirundo rustica rustica]